MIEVNDEAHLASLPDGSIIRWLRIPGDDTSEAVAFIRVEVESDHHDSIHPTPPVRTTWISPGGWQPMSIAEAGITYPVHVIHLGKFNPAHWPGSEAPLIGNGFTGVMADGSEMPLYPFDSGITNVMHGGTWPREAALVAAVTRVAGLAWTDEDILALADKFVAWLDPAPDPGNPPESMDHLSDQVAGLSADLDEILKPENSSGRSTTWRAQQLIERGWRRS